LARLLKKRWPLRLGLTGGIGAGKSSAIGFLETLKIPVLQTDHLSHQIIQDKKIIARLVKVFGRGILKGKAIDRSLLAQAAFVSPREQKKLNLIMHPAIRLEVKRWMAQQSKNASKPFIVVEVPLMFERGFNRVFDGILSISAPEKIREKRLKQRGWSPSEIRRRTKLQWPQSRKDRLADWVIYNQKSEKGLKYALYLWSALFL
jgi:dephospho-CoA kinase